MKINYIKDVDKFFRMIDQCKGAVRVVSDEGDNIVLNSKLSRFVITALAQENKELLANLEIKAEMPEDVERILMFLINQ